MVDWFPTLFRKTKLNDHFYFKQVGVLNQDIYLECFLKHWMLTESYTKICFESLVDY